MRSNSYTSVFPLLRTDKENAGIRIPPLTEHAKVRTS